MKIINVIAGALLAASLATVASAAEIVVTNVGVGNNNDNNVNVPGYGLEWTTPILMTTSTGGNLVVFCDDLQHVVYITGGQNLHYEVGTVTVDGANNTLTESQSNRMGQLADIGRVAYYKGDEDGAIAAQAAIWSIEYGINVTSTDATIQGDLAKDLLVKQDGYGYARGLIGLDGQQSQILGVPEPTTWAMILAGFGLVGFALRQHARQDRRLRGLEQASV